MVLQFQYLFISHSKTGLEQGPFCCCCWFVPSLYHYWTFSLIFEVVVYCKLGVNGWSNPARFHGAGSPSCLKAGLPLLGATLKHRLFALKPTSKIQLLLCGMFPNCVRQLEYMRELTRRLNPPTSAWQASDVSTASLSLPVSPVDWVEKIKSKSRLELLLVPSE